MTVNGASQASVRSSPDLNLAAIGNCLLGALVDPRARIVWCCFPRFDGDPVFCDLLGPGGDPGASGVFSVELEDLASCTQAYVRNTAILATTLTDQSGGTVQVVDLAPRFKSYDRLVRPPILLRRIVPVAGSPSIRIRIRPRSRYGAVTMDRLIGSNHISYHAGEVAFRVTTDAPISYVAEEVPFVLDGPVDLILGPNERVTAPIRTLAREFHERTEDYWHEWTRYLSVPFEWQEAVIRAAVTLKLCSFEETGAIIAALTTSIPEAPDSGRNWDYRYCWLRDAYFVVHALNQLGITRTMEEFIRYIVNAAVQEEGGRLRPVYAVVPGALLSERIATSLKGYRGMGPVRIGNLADQQVQNDIYGSVVLAAAQMFFDQRLPRMGDSALFERLEALGEIAARAAFEPDASLWEFRGPTKIHTYSSVMCWAACDRLGLIAATLGLGERAARWRDTAKRIRSAILEQAWDPQQNSFVDSFGGRELDASLLRLHEVGFVSAEDPRFAGTVAAIERRLRHGDHLFRYETADDFGVPTTAFTVCTFWYIDALAAMRRRGEARAIFERILACRNHVGLLSEGLDPRSGELWGNFPQSYSMVGLIVSAMRLSKSWRKAFRHT